MTGVPFSPIPDYRVGTGTFTESALRGALSEIGHGATRDQLRSWLREHHGMGLSSETYRALRSYFHPADLRGIQRAYRQVGGRASGNYIPPVLPVAMPGVVHGVMAVSQGEGEDVYTLYLNMKVADIHDLTEISKEIDKISATLRGSGSDWVVRDVLLTGATT